jgi:transposase-like protein
MVKQFAETLMAAEADAVCGAGYRERRSERVNSRNGYRLRDWDTRAGSIELAIPKLLTGSYFPEWLLERRRRAEQALVSVVATSYLLGVSTRRVEKLVAQLGSPSCPRARSRRWPSRWMSRWRRSGPARLMPGRTRSCGLTR